MIRVEVRFKGGEWQPIETFNRWDYALQYMEAYCRGFREYIKGHDAIEGRLVKVPPKEKE